MARNENFFKCPVLADMEFRGWKFDFTEWKFRESEIASKYGGQFDCPLLMALNKENVKFNFKNSVFYEPLRRAKKDEPYFYIAEENGRMHVQKAIEEEDDVSLQRYNSGNYFLSRFPAMERADRINELLKDR